jgi:hypothetical protein
MEKDIGYKRFHIWPVQLRQGKWGATVHRSPSRGAMATAGPSGGEAVPGDFDSKEAAIEAAKEYIDRKHVQQSR